MAYAEFLRKLLSLGPKLPEIIARIQDIIDNIEAIVVLVGGGFSAAMAPADASDPGEVASLENEIATAVEGRAGVISDGMRRLFDFVKAHPELMTLLLSLLVK